ncbi:hypothetical protein HMPREF1545_03440 [Oscillibacter sp. KLE 1728]|nr:hypothetical protein HMPREF1545_03440 [Oscillibacter sp. KLE 1728]ERK64785.1 hypothetical protein HMPREF1546_01562 [Oscillibacter sp. KLE 1745]
MGAGVAVFRHRDAIAPCGKYTILEAFFVVGFVEKARQKEFSEEFYHCYNPA